ncbi:hypothetical protein [Kribbella italica]|uniref:Restriction endonuclease type IV Mrr domain-containing protein n=1 Tax=Kribbella italica TaxID=1540520 RepID=A0A7W9JE83_9ACTN|nr:hypothetical protein [Kribbella italica]MBB5840115.1 hypothetical protein [Kribbella italica]
MPIELSLVISALVNAFRGIQWEVETGSATNPAGNDLIVTAPNQRKYVINIKLGDGSVHFATLAKVDHAAATIGRDAGVDVHPVLLTTQGVSPGIAGVADEVGVQVVHAAGSADEIADSVVEELKAS